MPILGASDAVVMGIDERMPNSLRTLRSIVTDSGQLLYDFRSVGIEIWPVACNAPRRLEFARRAHFSGRDAIGGPSILFQTPGPRVGSGGSAVVFAYRAVMLTTRFVRVPLLAAISRLARLNPLVRRLASSG
jgi:hypothetical protein